ncbi:hypothetical protein [Methanoculleus sp.]|jgi:hypothetical protein|uniref:hypothetical protein n=1 Tax=Methanoculleus sp. TaxID=90427 RepID=UPI0025D19B31|nr:hypothetical protein [Methanoculleus sp.]MCK9320267.1 hypothetical protein [Methanoculleus sp.]
MKKELRKDKQIYINKNMKLKQLIEGLESLGVLMGTKLPIVLSFKLSLFVKKINPEVEEYGKKRNELLKEYAEPIKDKDGKETGQMKFKDEKAIKAFNENIEELLKQDIKVDVPDIHINEFAGLEIEPKHLGNLEWLIKA